MWICDTFISETAWPIREVSRQKIGNHVLITARKCTEKSIFRKVIRRVLRDVKLIRARLNDNEVRDILCEAATNLEKALHFTRTLSDGFIYFPNDHDARARLVDASLTMQAALANEIGAMRIALETCDSTRLIPKMAMTIEPIRIRSALNEVPMAVKGPALLPGTLR